MYKYSYAGPVIEFGICVAGLWKASTYAKSEKKAKNNLAFQYKKMNNKVPNAKISFPGKIMLVQERNTN